MPDDNSREEDPRAAEPPATGEPAPDSEPDGEAQPDGQPAAQATPAAEPAPSAEPATDQAATEAGVPPRRSRPLIALAAAIVVLAAFGVWATLAAHSLRASATTQNAALADRPATAEVSRQVSQAVATIFSYSYADTARTRQAAQRLLTRRAIKQYNSLFALVEREAPQQKLIVTTKVTDTGVEYLTGNRARVLVFANQQDTRAGTHQSSYGGAMFAVTAIRTGTHWQIANIDTFTNP